MPFDQRSKILLQIYLSVLHLSYLLFWIGKFHQRALKVMVLYERYDILPLIMKQ